MTNPATYPTLLMRLMNAATKLSPAKALLIGLWWERWASHNSYRWAKGASKK